MRSSSSVQAARILICAFLLSLSGCRPGAGADSSSAVPTEAAADSLEILITGDVLLDRGVRPIAEKNGVEYLFREVTPLFRQADATIINLEFPFADTATVVSKGFIFKADTRWAPGLAAAGVTHAAMANNHTMDQGRRGIASTVRCLQQAGIVPLGYGMNMSEQLQPSLITKGGITVAVFNACMMTVENWQSLDGRPGVCIPSPDRLVKVVEEYHKSQPSAKIVAVLHWGWEFKAEPGIGQVSLARRLVQAGVSAVVGHHPHILQPLSEVDGVPVFYSLGNFVFDHTRPEGRKCAIARLVFYPDGELNYSSIPVDIVDNCPVPEKNVKFEQ